MPTTTLREPWFLEGRTSVWQRAVLMSLVLGGLGLVGGAGVEQGERLFRSVVDQQFPGYPHTLNAVESLLIGLIFALVAYLPCGIWLCHRSFGIAARILVTLLIANSQLHDGGVYDELVNGTYHLGTQHWIVDSLYGPPLNLGDLAWSLIHPIQFWLALCCVCFRWSWTWLAAAMASLLCVPTEALLMSSTIEAFEQYRRIPFPRTVWLWHQPVFWWSYFHAWWSLLLIPWGIPFWLPPPGERAPQ